MQLDMGDRQQWRASTSSGTTIASPGVAVSHLGGLDLHAGGHLPARAQLARLQDASHGVLAVLGDAARVLFVRLAVGQQVGLELLGGRERARAHAEQHPALQGGLGRRVVGGLLDDLAEDLVAQLLRGVQAGLEQLLGVSGLLLLGVAVAHEAGHVPEALDGLHLQLLGGQLQQGRLDHLVLPGQDLGHCSGRGGWGR